MSKVMLVMDEPSCCVECPFEYKSDEISLGNFTYRSLFRCKNEPDGINEENGDIVYLNEIMMNGKPCWCPLRPVPERQKHSSIDNEFQRGAKSGYNACINEILKD